MIFTAATATRVISSKHSRYMDAGTYPAATAVNQSAHKPSAAARPSFAGIASLNNRRYLLFPGRFSARRRVNRETSGNSSLITRRNTNSVTGFFSRDTDDPSAAAKVRIFIAKDRFGWQNHSTPLVVWIASNRKVRRFACTLVLAFKRGGIAARRYGKRYHAWPPPILGRRTCATEADVENRTHRRVHERYPFRS